MRERERYRVSERGNALSERDRKERERESEREGDFQLPGRIRILYTDLFYSYIL